MTEKAEKPTKLLFFRDIILIFFLSFILTLASMLFIDETVDLTIIPSFIHSPVIRRMNYLPVLAVMLIMYFVTGSVGGSFLITGFAILAMGVANQNKLFYRSDNVRATDLKLMREAMDMVGDGNSIRFQKLHGEYLLCLIAIGLILIKTCQSPLKKSHRIAGFAVSIVLSGWALHTVMIDRDRYWNNSMGRFHPYIEVERAKDRGMVYTFTYAYRDLHYRPPEEYDPDEAAAVLASYKESMPSDDKKVDIILMLGESFADLESKGAKVRPEVYASFRTLQEESIHGNIQNYCFGGGTIETERNVLAGVYSQAPYIKNRNSFAWLLKSEGYETVAMHPFTGKFYNRINTNKYIGIDNFLYSENYFDQYYINGPGDYFPDRILFPLVVEHYDRRDKSKPYFNLVTTMQNHTPYSTEDKGVGDYLDRASFTGGDEEYNSANNYLHGVKDTADQLLKMTRELEKRETPVVLVFFGDHLARLGSEGEIYPMMGIDNNLETPEGWLNHYTTPYLIWANSAAKKVLESDFEGEGPYFSNYMLFAYALDKLGFKSPYVQYLVARSKFFPFDSGSYKSEDGKLTSSPSEETQWRSLRHRWVQYYNTTHISYENLPDEGKEISSVSD